MKSKSNPVKKHVDLVQFNQINISEKEKLNIFYKIKLIFFEHFYIYT